MNNRVELLLVMYLLMEIVAQALHICAIEYLIAESGFSK
jgi:hypothetical protein